MKEKKEKKGRLHKRICGLLILMALLTATLATSVPVAAASYSFSKHWYAEAGQCFHLMNNDIAKNKITNFDLYIQMMTADAKYDVVFASADEYTNGEMLSTGCMVKGGNFSAVAYKGKSTYFKNSEGSNQGMVACIKVTSGRVRMKVKYNAGYSRASFKWEAQTAGHQPMRGYKVAQGKQIIFQRQGCDVDAMPILIAAPANTTVLQKLQGKSNYMKYTFNKDQLLFQYYENKIEQKDYRAKVSYSYTLGSKKYIMNDWPKELGANCNVISKKGTTSCYYPTDYFQVRVIK